MNNNNQNSNRDHHNNKHNQQGGEEQEEEEEEACAVALALSAASLTHLGLWEASAHLSSATRRYGRMLHCHMRPYLRRHGPVNMPAQKSGPDIALF